MLLPVFLGSCSSVEGLLKEEKVKEARVFCADEDGDDKRTCYKKIAYYYLNRNNIHAVFHYLPLHQSPFFKDRHDGRALPNAERFADTIVRLPFYYELGRKEIDFVVDKIKGYYE